MTISTWTPTRQIVAGITNANPAVITTVDNHGYHDGLFVRFVFPVSFGMEQLSQNPYQITVLSVNTFSINENTSNFDSFTISSSLQSPQVIPVGEVALTLINVEKNTLTPIGG